MDFFGLDIGSQLIKAIELESQKNAFYLQAFGTASSTNKGLSSESETDLTHLAEIIKKLHQEMKIKSHQVAVALPQDQIFLRVNNFPLLSDSELESALKWEAEQYVPIPLSEVTLSHQILKKIKDETGKETMEVLLAAAPNNLIDKILKVLKTAGLEPVSLEAEILAIGRALSGSDNANTEMILDLGAKSTDLAVTDQGQVIFVRSLPTAGESLTRAISQGLNLSSNQAEEYKKAYGLQAQNFEGKISQVIEPILTTLIDEINKTVQFFKAKQIIISRISLVGGMATLPQLASYLTQKVNLEVQVANPFSKITNQDLVAKIDQNEQPRYAVAMGLAMKKID